MIEIKVICLILLAALFVLSFLFIALAVKWSKKFESLEKEHRREMKAVCQEAYKHRFAKGT